MASCFLGVNVGSDDEYYGESDAAEGDSATDEDFGESNNNSRRAEYASTPIPRALFKAALEAVRMDEMTADAKNNQQTLGIGGAPAAAAKAEMLDAEETAEELSDAAVKEAGAQEAVPTLGEKECHSR